jgi:cation:H+ antiporter
VGIAQAFGVSDLIIGLTVVAVGTSLPELASSVAAARRGEDEIAFGNVVGSNMFNTLAVVGLAGVIRPFEADAIVRLRDAPAMLFFTLLLIIFGLAPKGRVGRVSRGEGVVLVLLYVGYMVALGSTL